MQLLRCLDIRSNGKGRKKPVQPRTAKEANKRLVACSSASQQFSARPFGSHGKTAPKREKAVSLPAWTFFTRVPGVHPLSHGDFFNSLALRIPKGRGIKRDRTSRSSPAGNLEPTGSEPSGQSVSFHKGRCARGTISTNSPPRSGGSFVFHPVWLLRTSPFGPAKTCFERQKRPGFFFFFFLTSNSLFCRLLSCELLRIT